MNLVPSQPLVLLVQLVSNHMFYPLSFFVSLEHKRQVEKYNHLMQKMVLDTGKKLMAVMGAEKKVGGIVTEEAREGVGAACVLPLDDYVLIAGGGEAASVLFKH